MAPPEAPPTPPSRNPVVLAIVAIVLVAVLLVAGLYLAGVGPFANSGKNSNGSTAGGTYSAAEQVANKSADNYGGGPWHPAFAAAVVLSVATLESTNLSAVVSSIPGATCRTSVVGGQSTTVFPASNGNGTNGQSPDWLILLANDSGTGLFVIVLGSSGQVADRLDGCSSFLHVLGGIPGNAIDSPAAMQAGMSDGGYAFMKAHPGGNATDVVYGGLSIGFGSTAGSWIVSYTTCPWTSAVSASATYYQFSAKVDLNTGAVVGSPTNGTTHCGSPFGLSNSARPVSIGSLLTAGPTLGAMVRRNPG